MGLTYGFFDSVDDDRVYSAADFGTLLNGIITDGVFMDIGDAFTILESSGMIINIQSGKAWFEGIWINADTGLLRTVSAAHATLDRIDAVVIKVDKTSTVRNCNIKMVDGTPSATPVAPTLATGPNLFEFKIGEVYVNAAATEIVQDDITPTIGLPGSADWIKGFDTDDLVLLSARVASNETDIADLLTDVATNTAAISTIQGDLDGKASTFLSNLNASNAINADLRPNLTNTRSLGTSSLQWLNAFLDKATFGEDAAPSTPTSGKVVLYAKTDGKLYSMDDLGNETQVSGGFESPLTTKGDLLGFSTVETRLPVGTNGYILSADSAEVTGLKWITPPAGGGGYSGIGAMLIVNETPTGTVDGTNDDFVLANTPVSGTELVYRDGQLMKGGSADYSISGDTITFTTPPVVGSVILVTYQINAAIDSATFNEGAAPGTPASGDVVIYAKTDGLLYSKDDAGLESPVSAQTKPGFQALIVRGDNIVETGDGKYYFVIPDEWNGFNLVRATADYIVAGVTGTGSIQIRNVTQAVDMLSSAIAIASGATHAEGTIDTANDDVATDDVLAVDVDAVQTGTIPQGLIVTCIFEKP